MGMGLRRMYRALGDRIQRYRGRYKLPRRPFRQLPSDALEQVEMKMDGEGETRPKNELFKIWQGIPGGHKWWHYFDVYEEILGTLRQRPIRFLEIGVYKGASLAMWRRYLHPMSVIVGIDIDPDCARFEDISSSVYVRIGDQSDTDFLEEVFRELGPFDVILDDGSHQCSHMIRTFGYAFLHGLNERGVYVVEDTHTNFWPSHRDQNYSFIDLCKDLVDLSHAHYMEVGAIAPFSIGSPRRVRALMTPRIGLQISEIRFLDSIVVVRRDAFRRLPTVEHL